MPRKPRKPAAEKLAELPGNASKTRLRKLVCSESCGYPPMRVSRRAIELGLPTCPCGGKLWPWDLEDLYVALQAGSLTRDEWEAHPLVIEFGRELDRVQRGQHGHIKRAAHLDNAEAIATLRVQLAVAEDAAELRRTGATRARRERLNAADPAAAARVAEREADEIPF